MPSKSPVSISVLEEAVTAPIETPPPVAPVSPSAQASAPIQLLTEMDSYLKDRQAAQPPTLEALKSRIEITQLDRNRLSLPDYFEAYSYDCTLGQGCHAHTWTTREVELQGGTALRSAYQHHGDFLFRWVGKDKRKLDYHLTVKHWALVNRVYFPDAPRHLFTANGCVEVGDNLLLFMPVKQALALRALPGQLSSERVKGRITPGKRRGSVLMTGNPEDSRFYEPKLAVGDEQDGPEVGATTVDS